VEGDKNALVPYDHAIRHIARRYNLPVFGMTRSIAQHRGRRSTGLATFDHISQRYDGPPCGDGEGGEDDGGGRGGGTTTGEKKGRSTKKNKEQGKEAVMAEETKKGERKKGKETNMKNTNTIANVGDLGKNPLLSPIEPLLHAPDFGTCTFLDLLRFRAAIEQLHRPIKCGLLLQALAKRGSHITLDNFCACVSPAPKRGGVAWARRGEGGLLRRTMGDIGMCYLYGSEEMLADRARKCKYTRGSGEVLTIAIERF